MFGLKGRKPIELVPFATSKPRTFNTLLCDGVTAYNLPSFAELLALHARLQRELPSVRVLATLDDVGQAAYTSGHCIDANQLDDTEGHDLSALGPELFEDGEHQGYLSTPAEFPIRLANLQRAAQGTTVEQVAAALCWKTPGDANDLITINSDAEKALRISDEQGVIFQFVPVAAAANTLAAFPNGYFHGDLNPMQNHAVARHLESEFGLGLFGIGSRHLGFRTESILDERTARAAAAVLASLYADVPAGAMHELARLLAGRDWLLIRYTES